MREAEAFMLDLIRDAARKGERCPVSYEIVEDLLHAGHSSHHAHNLPRLARQGHCRIEVYGKNWRVIEIDGLRTKEPPFDGKPYHVIEKGSKPREACKRVKPDPRRGRPLKSVWKSLPCLMCRQRFDSSGPEERVCGGCKQTEKWQSGGGVGYPVRAAQ